MSTRFVSMPGRAPRLRAAVAFALALALVSPLAAQTTRPSGSESDFEVPAGAAPVIDGSIGEDEWRDARPAACAPDGPIVLLKHDEAFLYLAIQNPGADRVTSVFLQDGARILVLHASQALGTAEYAGSGAEWKIRRGFEWTFRASGDAAADARARRAFESAEGWFASTATMGPGQTEFAISLKRLRGQEQSRQPRLAVAAFPGGIITPPALADACGDRPLLMGQTPATLRFDPQAWLRLASATDWGK